MSHIISKSGLLEILKRESVFYGDYVLSSGAKSTYYIDCKLTTLNPEGAWSVGHLMYEMIQKEAQRRGVQIDAVGGLTMGADPIALAIGMASYQEDPQSYFQVFTVRKSPKAHGQHTLIEGKFKSGNRVVVIDDVVTRGDSTIRSIEAVQAEGGIVEFIAVFVDRQQGGRQKIEEKGFTVLPLFDKTDLISENASITQSADRILV